MKSVYKNVEVCRLGADESIACVTITRPLKLNAIDAVTLAELESAFTWTRKSKLVGIKCAILRGAGEKAFSSGLDLTSASTVSIMNASDAEVNPNERADEIRETIGKFQKAIIAIVKFPLPVICAIEGVCFGLGIDLAAACDVRVASESASFSVREVKIGICADLGSLFFLPRICRSDSWVRDICLTGRIFGALEAYTNGFVSHVVEQQGAFEKSVEIAKMIVSNESVAVEGTKHNLNFSSRQGLDASFAQVALWNSVKMQQGVIGGNFLREKSRM